jgi:peptidoglycan hydrolase-like protein with peptidoglycan-binding domain
MATTATKVLNIARSQLGYRATRSKRNKYGRWYGMDGVNWCDIFVSWVGVQAGARDIVGRAAFTPAHADWFRARGRWGHTPKRGAIVFFDFPDSVHRIQHIGIVERVRSDGRIVTIEGNTSSGAYGSQYAGGGVYRRVRSQSLVAGYGYPAYGGERDVKSLGVSRGSRPPLIVDGQWGRNTTRALQRFVGVSPDGEIGPQTRKALQRKLRIDPADGTWGRVTRRVVQRTLGVTDDGDWGPQTIRALQRKLNGDWRA